MKKKILIIDDDPDDREFAQEALVNQKYQVYLSIDGKSGIEIAQREKPDLIILDCVLPGLSGVDTCKQLKENPATKAIPILFLTGLNTPANIIDCYEMEPENFLAKPLRNNELISHVEMILDDIKE